MKALLLDVGARTAEIHNISRPTPGSTELLVRVESISLNPIDPLYVAHPLGDSGRTIGSDFAGTIVELGYGIPRTNRLRTGDYVAGFLQGACSVNERPGAFAEFVVVPWDLVWKIPSTTKIAQAAGVSLVALTAAQAIWYRLGMGTPFAYDRKRAIEEHPDKVYADADVDGHDVINVFIYGASTSVALYAAQMVRISGRTRGKTIRMNGAASRARWDFLQAEPYRYDGLVDYRDGDWPEQIRKHTGGIGIHYAFDCISEGSSVEATCSTLTKSGKAAIVRSREGGAWGAHNLPSEPSYGAVWEGLGEEVQYQGFTVRQSLSAREFTVAFYAWLSDTIGSDLVPNPVRMMPGGLERVVEDGFLLLGAGGMEERQTKHTEEWMRPVSAEKLVYNL